MKVAKIGGGLVAALAVLLALTACVPEASPGPDGLGAAEVAACQAGGGWIAQGGMLGRNICFSTPEDAGKSCSKAGDCTGPCLAETNSCAAVQPMFGCFEMLDENGSPIGLCVD